MEELNNYLEQDIHKSTSIYLSKIFEDQKLTVSQKLFLSYVRGSADNLGSYTNVQKSENFIDLDAIEEFADSMCNRKNKVLFDESTKEWWSEIEAWKQKN